MLLYVDALVQEVESITEYARFVQEKFAQQRTPEELLLDSRVLNSRAVSLDAMMPDGTSTGNLLRHTGFMIYWLERRNINACSSDIADILERDLPDAKNQIEQWSRQLAFIDEELRQQVLPLLRTKQFDSAVRKAFVILKARLCRKFSLDESEDGTRLINQIFAVNADFIPELPSGQKQAYRDFFAGLFGLLRNKFAHQNSHPTFSELDTILSSINLCLHVVGDFKVKDDTVP